MLNNESSLLRLSSHLRGSNVVFESSIRGSSMAPSIPGLARVRVQVSVDQSTRRGDIVYFQTNDGFMIHRVVWQTNRGRVAGFLLTRGDNCLVPDPPVPKRRVLGTVFAVEINKGWRLPAAPVTAPVFHLLIRTLSLIAMIGALRMSMPLAYWLATALQTLEFQGRRVAKVSVGGILRRLGLRQ